MKIKNIFRRNFEFMSCHHEKRKQFIMMLQLVLRTFINSYLCCKTRFVLFATRNTLCVECLMFNVARRWQKKTFISGCARVAEEMYATEEAVNYFGGVEGTVA